MARTQLKNTEMSREAGRSKATDSTIAKLPETTSTATVRAAKLAGLKTGNNFTGQYLYERFVVDKAEGKLDITKMDIVRQMSDVMEANEFEVTLAGMVGFAKRDHTAAIEAAKAAGNFDSENPTWPIREAAARLKTARNHQTVMRTAYGALKFCADELASKLGDQPLSYRMVREIGAKLLGDKGIDWKGNKVEDSGRREARRHQETETAAMLEVQKAHPRKEGESRAAYFARIDAETEAKVKELEAADRIKGMAKMADKIRSMAGSDLAEILDILLSADAAPQPEGKAKAGTVLPKADVKLH